MQENFLKETSGGVWALLVGWDLRQSVVHAELWNQGTEKVWCVKIKQIFKTWRCSFWRTCVQLFQGCLMSCGQQKLRLSSCYLSSSPLSFLFSSCQKALLGKKAQEGRAGNKAWPCAKVRANPKKLYFVYVESSQHLSWTKACCVCFLQGWAPSGVCSERGSRTSAIPSESFSWRKGWILYIGCLLLYFFLSFKGLQDVLSVATCSHLSAQQLESVLVSFPLPFNCISAPISHCYYFFCIGLP